MARETTTALNCEVSIPRHSTTAKPFTGPEPSRNRKSPAMSVVTFESKIVPHARS